MEYEAMEQYWIWLCSIDGIGVKRFYQLLSEYEDARSVWDNAGQQMAFLGEKAYRNLMAARNEAYFYALFAKLDKLGIRAVTRLSDDYPKRLTQITDPPPTLFVRGNPNLNIEKAIGVVGSRQATRDGRRAATEIAEGLSQEGVTVVSGLARGIDSCAHQGALKGRGHTVAVLGSGVDVVYPPENGGLLQMMIDDGGAVVSEYMPGTQPLAQHFPARNRLISGMAEGVLFVEGDDRSGAMITANYALEQGKDIFVVPGSIYAPLSRLPNKLLMDGAIPVLSHWDIAEYYRWGERSMKKSAKAKTPVQLSEEEARIVSFIEKEEHSFDELVMVTGIDSQKLNSHLTMLELRGIIEKAPGRVYYRR